MKYACSPRVVATELRDGTGVLLHLDSLFYFTLNATGLAVWRSLERGEASIDSLADGLAREFEVEPDRAMDDVRALLEALLAERLVDARPSSSPDR